MIIIMLKMMGKRSIFAGTSEIELHTIIPPYCTECSVTKYDSFETLIKIDEI